MKKQTLFSIFIGIVVFSVVALVLTINLKVENVNLSEENQALRDEIENLKFDSVEWRPLSEIPNCNRSGIYFNTCRYTNTEGCFKFYDGYFYMINNTDYCNEEMEFLIGEKEK